MKFKMTNAVIAVDTSSNVIIVQRLGGVGACSGILLNISIGLATGVWYPEFSPSQQFPENFSDSGLVISQGESFSGDRSMTGC